MFRTAGQGLLLPFLSHSADQCSTCIIPADRLVTDKRPRHHSSSSCLWTGGTHSHASYMYCALHTARYCRSTAINPLSMGSAEHAVMREHNASGLSGPVWQHSSVWTGQYEEAEYREGEKITDVAGCRRRLRHSVRACQAPLPSHEDSLASHSGLLSSCSL